MDVLRSRTWLIFFTLAVVNSLGHTTSAWGQTSVEIATEPGFVAKDGSWILPYRLKPAGAGDIELSARRDGEPIPVQSQLRYAFGTDQESATALVITFDLPRLDSTVGSRWAADLVALADPDVTPGLKIALQTCGPEETRVKAPRSKAISRDEAETFLQYSAGRLWDCVIAAIDALADDDLPERRVVLLVSDGHEEVISRHVMTSCVEAALRARVAIFVLSLAPEDDAAAARLGDLARRTGGQLIEAPVPNAENLSNILSEIGAARGLKFDPSELDEVSFPVKIALQVEGNTANGDASVGEIAPRMLTGKSNAGRWLLIVCALLIAGATGFFLRRQRSVLIGELLINTKNGERRFPVNRDGVTIGRDEDNSMVLPSRNVSRHHAVIRVNDGQVVLTDLRSTRGTKVNDQPIGTCQLAENDRIVLGGAVTLVYKEQKAAREAAKSSEG